MRRVFSEFFVPYAKETGRLTFQTCAATAIGVAGTEAVISTKNALAEQANKHLPPIDPDTYRDLVMRLE